jgi:hypothetical protein
VAKTAISKIAIEKTSFTLTNTGKHILANTYHYLLASLAVGKTNTCHYLLASKPLHAQIKTTGRV